MTNVSRKDKLVCLNNLESQVLATCCITQMNLVMCRAFVLRQVVMFVKSFCFIRDLVSYVALFRCGQLIVCCFGFKGWNSNQVLCSYFKSYFRPLLSSYSLFVEKTISVFAILAWNIKRFQEVLQRVANTCVSEFFICTS